MQDRTWDLYGECCVFPLVDSLRYLEAALANPAVQAVVLGEALNVLNARRVIRQVKDSGRYAFVDLDLVGGLNGDEYAVNYLVKEAGIDGLITKRRACVPLAKRHGVWTVLKVFANDRQSVESAIGSISFCEPDAFDILPGVASPFALPLLRQASKCPAAISGFYGDTPQAVARYLHAGISAVHTRNQALWNETRSTLLV